jgi:hypothetical protein
MENLERGYPSRNICILSHSQAMNKALDSYHINSKLVCHQSLVKLAECTSSEFNWFGCFVTEELRVMELPINWQDLNLKVALCQGSANTFGYYPKIYLCTMILPPRPESEEKRTNCFCSICYSIAVVQMFSLNSTESGKHKEHSNSK